MSEDCCCEEPSPCCDPDFTGSFEVELDGVVDACDECEAVLNGIHELMGGGCTWASTYVGGIGDCLGISQKTLTFFEDAGEYKAQLTISAEHSASPNTVGAVFIHSFGATKPDCGAISQLTLTLDQILHSPFTFDPCDFTNITAIITAIPPP